MAAVAGKDDNVGEVVDHVLATRERVFVERNGAPAAVIMSARELEGLEYTIDLLSEPKTVRRILAAEAALQSGNLYMGEETQTPDSSCVP
jgi:prevent-host-death family protein